MLFFLVYPESHPRLQTFQRFSEYRSTPSPVFSYSYKLPPLFRSQNIFFVLIRLQIAHFLSPLFSHSCIGWGGVGVLQRSKVQPRQRSKINPLSFHALPHSFALFCTFCTHAKLNSLVFKRFRTLCEKHRVRGGCFLLPTSHESPVTSSPLFSYQIR